MLAWVVGTVISLLPVHRCQARRQRNLYRPDWTTLWRLRKLALAHDLFDLAIDIPGKLIPVLVVLVYPLRKSAFYIATIISISYQVCQSLSTGPLL